MAPGSCAEVSPLAGGFFVCVCGGFVCFSPEVLRAFEIGLLKVSQAGSIFPSLSWSFEASLAWSHPADAVNLT